MALPGGDARRTRLARRLALALVGAALAFALPAADTQRTLAAIDGSWDAWRAEREAADATRLAAAAAAAVSAAIDDAQRALDAPPTRAGAFAALAPLATAPRGAVAERSIVLLERGAPLAWAGPTRVPVDGAAEGVSVVQTPFYVALAARASRGARSAVATVLVDAAPPADAFSAPLDRVVHGGAGARGFEIGPAVGVAGAPGWRVVDVGGRPVLRVRALPLGRDETRLRVVERGRARSVLGLALLVLIAVAAVWWPPSSARARLAALLVPLGALAAVPFASFSNVSSIFDPGIYFAPLGGPFTATIGALGLTSAVALLALFTVLRAGPRVRSPRIALLLVLAIGGVAPFLLRSLSRGIAPPALGASVGLWVAWQIALFLAAAAILVAGAAAGRGALGAARGLPPLVAPVLAAVAALAAPALWQAPSGWPEWYPLLWIAAIVALALTHGSRAVLVAAVAVAGLGSATLVWGAAARTRVALAARDVAALAAADPDAEPLLERFARALAGARAPDTPAALLRRFAASPLAAGGWPVSLGSWQRTGAADSLGARVAMTTWRADTLALRALVAEARTAREPVLRPIAAEPGMALAVAVPHGGDGAGIVTTAVVFPRARLVGDEPIAPLLGFASGDGGERPYTVSLLARDAAVTAPAPRAAAPQARWTRDGTEVHGDWTVPTPTGPARAHVEVELRALDALAQRGALLVLLDLLVAGALWVLPAAADGGARRSWRAWRASWARSFRARLTLALFAFFVVPATVFAVWSYRQLRRGDRQARELLVRETLRTAAGEVPWTTAAGVAPEPGAPLPTAVGGAGLASLAARLGTPLAVYERGELARASDPLLLDLAPLGRYLPPAEMLSVGVGDEVTVSRTLRVGRAEPLLGFRAVVAPGGERFVLAAPARTDAEALDQRRRDLGYLVLLAAAGGAIAALWLSGVAARALARPVGALREAAYAVAAGEREPGLAGDPPAEFRPVFFAFRRMAEDLSASRAALEAAQRRTEAVLRNVASGVMAIDADACVRLVNPRAEALLDRPLRPGDALADVAPAPLVARVRDFLAAAAAEDEFEIELHGRQLRARLTRLGLPAARGGAEVSAAVLTLDDLTELARAQRVLAWGEMARQVAHEIKNPLTPIRLGVQHLRRAYHDGRSDYDTILDRNVGRILEEIDRLDEIARAFSRYGAAPDERPPAEAVDVAAVARDVVALERMGQGSVAWELDGADAPRLAFARDDELREVLLNLLENARLAHARTVRVHVGADDGVVSLSVADDGEGIPDDALSRVFEPHFSTRTSGSGLGLAISRRMVERWGGTIALTSARHAGTTVTVTLRAVTSGEASRDRPAGAPTLPASPRGR